ncbi:MAG: chloride channel protein, partial [Limisphaerales bacterium]
MTSRIKSSTTALKHPLGHPTFWLVSVLVGVVAGLGAVIFRGLIGGFHNLFFLGKLSFFFDTNLHTPASPWGAWIILAPVVGALGVAFLVKTFAPEARGHGVPEVMDAVYYHKGIIRPIVAAIKSLASALSIGSGGSVGREGPIVQIGSSFGSSLGQLLRLPAWQRITLVAAGAGGGIAATFNTPIGGILFATELLLPEISARTLIPVAMSTATATYIGRWLLGINPSFVIPGFQLYKFHLTSLYLVFACPVLGCLLGVVATVFTKSIYWFEDFFDRRISKNYYVRHVLGMLLVGIIIYVTQTAFGHYYVEGVGYATVQQVLTGALSALPLLLLLFVLKVIVTSLTLGSGGSGGIFSPSLFLGATFGAAFGLVLKT